MAGGGIAGIWPLTSGTAARTLLVALSFTTIIGLAEKQITGRRGQIKPPSGPGDEIAGTLENRDVARQASPPGAVVITRKKPAIMWVGGPQALGYCRIWQFLLERKSI